MQSCSARERHEARRKEKRTQRQKAAKEIESMGIEDFVKVFSLIENIKNSQDEKVQKQGVQNGQQP